MTAEFLKHSDTWYNSDININSHVSG